VKVANKYKTSVKTSREEASEVWIMYIVTMTFDCQHALSIAEVSAESHMHISFLCK
jgi:hypothetical protein